MSPGMSSVITVRRLPGLVLTVAPGAVAAVLPVNADAVTVVACVVAVTAAGLADHACQPYTPRLRPGPRGVPGSDPAAAT